MICDGKLGQVKCRTYWSKYGNIFTCS